MSLEETSDDLDDGGAPGEGEGRGGEEGEAIVDMEKRLLEAKYMMHKIAKSLLWNYMRYVITN